MAKGAYVGSVESVQELLVALLNFIPDCRELIDEGRTVIECGSTTLEIGRAHV